ncbi:MAG: zinc finger domain-containing protein [Pseudomonadota bacterium]
MSKILNIFEAAILLKMSPNLLGWFISYSPKYKEKRKLSYADHKDEMYFFDEHELLDFDKYLSMPWPAKKKDQRPIVPSGIEDEIKSECKFRCVICNHASGQIAHIDPIHNSQNNHPHNLIYLCPNCHDLYDNKKAISKHQIVNLKKNLLHTKIVIWKSCVQLIDSVSSLIKELEVVKHEDFTNKKLKKETISELLHEIRRHASAEFDKHSSDIKENATKKIFEEYKKRVREIIDGNIDVEEKLFTERDTYIFKTGKVECPLCNGTGIHNAWACPVCRGVGAVDEEAVDEIDLTPFKQEECPLCEGSGTHNAWECPVCRGVGTVDQEAVDVIDLTLFKQGECPLCEGSGTHNAWACPVCRGVGTVDEEAVDEIDLTPFKQEECPLCEGSGTHNAWECPVCRGVGTVDQETVDEIDLTLFEQVDCPECNGTGVDNGWECRACRGIGTTDRRNLE